MNSADFYPSKLWAVANDCHRPAPELDIYQIRDKILQKCDKEICRIEWFWIITNNQAWQDLPPEESQQLAIEIWAIAFELYSHMNCFEPNNDDYWLLKELSHRLLFKQSQKLAKSLIKSWDEFPSNRCPNEAKSILEILKIIHNYPANIVEVELLKLTYQYKLLPSQLWAKTDSILPRLDCLKRYFYQLPSLFTKIEKNVPVSTQFFIEILENINDFASEDEQAKVVNLCLIQWQVEFFDDKSRLLQWFIKEYHKTSKGSLLSSGAISKLSQIVGLKNYQIFDRITQSVIDNVLSKDYTYDDKKRKKEVNKLNARKDFWKNYTDNFVSISVFLPRRTFNLISNQDAFTQAYVYELKDDGSEESEVCIFELNNDLLIVEIFRGRGNDLRIFTGHYRNQLLNDPFLSIQKIRALGGKHHDHVALWQYFCEQLLRTQYEIYPNQNIYRFHGLPPQHAKYSRTKGLPTPNQEGLEDRKKQLDKWEEHIKELERKARRTYPQP